MKKMIFTACAAGLLLGLNSCKSTKNISDWEGVYVGTVPCADCRGIQTQITLNPDNTYQMSTLYLDKDAGKENYQGTFQWGKENVITLGNLEKHSVPVYYKVGESTLTQLDMEGKAITGQGASDYVLVKLDKDLLDKEWILTEIQGTPVTPGAENTKTAFITFKAEDTRMSGNSGCNTFSGVYQLKPGNGISFSKMVSTRMMCLNNMDIESKINEISQIIDSYTVSGNTLTLNRGKEILARFVKK